MLDKKPEPFLALAQCLFRLPTPYNLTRQVPFDAGQLVADPVQFGLLRHKLLM
jgi:hypothetical protein